MYGPYMDIARLPLVLCQSRRSVVLPTSLTDAAVYSELTTTTDRAKSWWLGIGSLQQQLGGRRELLPSELTGLL
jgi:hypothetical protein